MTRSVDRPERPEERTVELTPRATASRRRPRRIGVSGKTANMAAIFGTRTKRRTAAARAVAGSGLTRRRSRRDVH